nr:gamma-glutamyltransferase [Acanthopleuribacter pedis]
MVASAHPAATNAGVAVLAKGGNAVDAAVATAFALSVCEPQASGLGGQSIGMVHINGETYGLDGSSRVPEGATLAAMAQGDRKHGYRATTVPSTPAFLGYLHFREGRLSWRDVLEPAIQLARDGYAITALQHRLQHRELKTMLAQPGRRGAHYFLHNDLPIPEGQMFCQPDLAGLLESLADHGVKSFYRGAVAARIDADMRANGGFLTAADLARIPWPVIRKPIHRNYRGLQVVTMPPPAAGRVLLLVLMMLNHFPSRMFRKMDAHTFHLLAELFRKAMIQRRERPYDPDTYPLIQNKLSRKAARAMAQSIREDIDPSLPMVDPPNESGDTTHLSVMDAEGGAVGITQSIERVYGAQVACEGLGFLYNNYLMALETQDPKHPYFLKPGAVPWSTVAPTLLFHKERPWMVVGSPGSERIFSAISQFLLRTLDGKQGMGAALAAPRLHCSVGGKVSLEADRFDPDVISYLEKKGYKIDRREPYAFYLGAVHATVRCVSGKGFQGVAEVRRDGTAAGPD